MTATMTAVEAIARAIDIIEAAFDPKPGDEWMQIIERLSAIAEQKGCEHLDPACHDGRLTTLIDIVIDG